MARERAHASMDAVGVYIAAIEDSLRRGNATEHTHRPALKALSLMQTFDEIHVLDLHGNLKKREVAPDGSKEKSVFDIPQGVAICLMLETAFQ